MLAAQAIRNNPRCLTTRALAFGTLECFVEMQSIESELHSQVCHVPELDVCTRTVANRLQPAATDLVTPQLVVLQPGRFDGKIGLHQCAAHFVDVMRNIREAVRIVSAYAAICVRRADDLIGKPEQDQIRLASPDESRSVVRVPAECLPNARRGVGVVCAERAEAIDEES